MRTSWVLAAAIAILTPILFLAPASALPVTTDASPSIGVSPVSMSFDVPPDATDSADLTITNRGDAPLHYTISPETIAGSMSVPSTITTAEVHTVDWTADHVPGRLIVGLKPGAAAASVSSLHAQLGTTVKESFKIIAAQVVEVKKGSDLRKVAEAYMKNPQVAYAEPDYLMDWCVRPNDPSVPGWFNTISAWDAWDVTTGSDDVTVAVLDSGLDVTHPDLEANVWTNPGEIPGNGIDDDHNGFVDDVHGWNFWNNNGDVTDIFGHGTHCSGIVGAVGNNGIGIVGVNWKVKLMMVKLGNEQEGPTSMIIAGLQYAVKMGARISSNSYGGSVYSRSFYDSITAAGASGHLFVAAAGNDGTNNDIKPFYPCSYDLDNVISVAAFGNYLQLSSFSNYGAVSVDLAAPGEGIYSTFPPHTYKVWQGTSMACPHVAGTAALVLSHAPELTPTQVKSRILSGVDKYDWFAGKLVSGGMLNVYRSLGIPWLDVTPATGEIAPGESAVIRVGVNAKALYSGYQETCQLNIESDDLSNPSVSVPVTLSVNDYVWISYSTPLPNTEDTAGPYNVEPYLGANAGLDPSSLRVYWNTTGSGTFNEAPMVCTDPIASRYRAQIPGQPAGTTVYYYICAGDALGHVEKSPLTAPASLHRFEVLADTTPPVIEHVPLQDTSNRVGPYQVSATVTDAMGVGSVTLYWTKNGGAFTSLAMTKSGDRYTGSIPGPENNGDRICYYISATDASARQNTGTCPAGAPDVVNCFTVGPCGVDVIGDMSSFMAASDSARANAFQCTSGAYLTKIEQFLAFPQPTNLRFFVYEAGSSDGEYAMIHENVVSSPTTGAGWYSSGPISVQLVAGRYYIIGVAWTGAGTWYARVPGHPVSVGFGTSRVGYSFSEYPPASVDMTMMDGNAYYQRLTTCQGSRHLTVAGPNGGEWIETGETVQIGWSSGGPGWVSGDTVRIEYSTDSGAAWNAVPGAENLPYDVASCGWDTSGITSTQCRVRVVYNGDAAITDASDADFVVQTDTTPPTITHVPLGDTGHLSGPYRVCASVTDNLGVGSVTLYWSRNGSTYSSVPMARSGPGNEYCAEMPGQSAAGDQYCYYIEAADASAAANAGRNPAGGPDAPICFQVTACGTDEVGGTSVMTTATNCSRGNVFACTRDSVLTGIEQTLGVDSSTELRFFVYESMTEQGTYNKIHETLVPSTGTGLVTCSSGPISVELVAGRYYIIAVSWKGSCMYYTGGSHPVETAFGRSLSGFSLATYLPPATTTNPGTETVVNQQLSACQIDRSLRITSPNGGQAYEAGNVIRIEWTSRGRYWQSGETVHLACSADGGATWVPIAGAESLPHDQGSFDWNTTGVPESTTYRVRVAYNGGPAVSDHSDADFAIVTDATPPVISHTPLGDTQDRTGPYRVCATVTDEHGVAEVTLHWRKNSGEFAVVPMTLSGTADEYCAEIPGPGVVGAKYQYYIEASDVSAAHNTSRHPSGAPESVNSFTITACSIDSLGGTASNATGTRYVRGNVYECTSTLTLTQIEQYLNITSSAELRFSVYESPSLTGVYTKIHETVVPSSGTGLKWYSSGPVSVDMVAGRCYIITASCGGMAAFYLATAGHPVAVSFGQSRSGYQSNIYPPRTTASNPNNPAVFYQRLSTCAPSGTISQVKCSADDETAILADEAVSAVFPGRFYVQKTDRSCGIGVLWPGVMPAVGDHIGVVGVTATIDHERLIDAASVEVTSIGTQPRAIAMTNYRVGGNSRCYSPGPPLTGQKGFEGAIGPNNIGLLVTTWGRVNEIGEGYVYIDDGSALSDGANVSAGLRVICDPTGRSIGDYLRVTGVSSCFASPSGGIARRILVSRPEDMAKLN